jgi:tetratricopeptide (TPR) repeat protein
MKRLFLISILLLSAIAQAQKSSSEDLGALFNKAVEQIGKQNYEGAIPFLDQAIQLNGAYTEAIFARGTCYLMLNKRNQACDDFHAADKLNHFQAKEYIQKYCKRKSNK